MIGGDLVDIPAAGQFFYWPQRVVPASAHDPFTRLGGFHPRAYAVTELGQRLHAHQVHGQAFETSVGQMEMRVVESGHHEVSAQIDDLGLRPFQLENLVLFARRLDAITPDSHRFRPLDFVKRRYHCDSGVNVAVEKNDVGFRFCLLLLRQSHGNCAQHEDRCSQVHPLTPASASRVSRMRLSPSSRPLQSNHSCRVWAPPPRPPPPMAMASRPSDSGMLASVEARCTCAAFPSCASTARITCRMGAFESSSPAGRLPITTTSQLSPKGRRCDEARFSEACDSSSTAWSSASRRACSRRSISAIEVERISTRMLADSGMEFTEVPPRITPMLKVVLGDEGTGVSVNASMARASTRIGLGAPKSLQECPPGPRTMTSKRRLPRASATIVSDPAPSSTRL